MRWLRLILVIGFLIAFARQGDWFLLFIASYFLVQVIFNLGCGGSSCAVETTDSETKPDSSQSA